MQPYLNQVNMHAKHVCSCQGMVLTIHDDQRLVLTIHGDQLQILSYMMPFAFIFETV